jgi:hypothetical protein
MKRKSMNAPKNFAQQVSTNNPERVRAADARRDSMVTYNPAPDAASPSTPSGQYWELKITR